MELMNVARRIYQNLGDGLSKKLYMDKILFAMSGDRRYVEKIVFDSMKNIGEDLDSLSTDEEVIIYGAGINLEFIFSLCELKDIRVDYICDKDPNKQGKKYREIEIISLDKLLEEHIDAKIIISTTNYFNEALAFLRSHFKEEQIILCIEDAVAKIKNQYFDDVLRFQDGEVFVDGGCFDFETSKKLLSKCSVEKIYVFEPDSYNVKKVKSEVQKMNLSNVEIFNAGMWECNTTLRFNSQGSIMSKVDEKGDDEIKVVSLDEVVEGRVTFIKMDIEGSELKALKGAERTIKQYKPKLAISIYHKLEDIIEIPEYIMSIVPEYKFYIRHYSLNEAETVLYAVVE